MQCTDAVKVQPDAIMLRRWRRRRCLSCLTCLASTLVLVWVYFSYRKQRFPGTGRFPHMKSYTDTGSARIFIFSAIGLNTSEVSHWDMLAVNIWLPNYENETLHCCYMLANSTIVSREAATVHHRREMFNQTAQVECSNPIAGFEKHHLFVSLSDTAICSKSRSSYVKPAWPLRSEKAFSMAICAKIAYGEPNVNLTIEWMEYNRHMGVDHVVIYQCNLSETIRNVFRYYEEIGFLEMLEFDFPQSGGGRHVGDKTPDAWNDEQVVVYDCQTRLRGYRYVSVLDLDEFIVPLMDTNYRGMLDRLMTLVPSTASIEFYGELYVIDWGKSEPYRELTIEQYTRRTVSRKPVAINQRKLIHLPARVERGSVVTHGCKTADDSRYKIWKDPMSVLGMNHYRRCLGFRDDCMTQPRYVDQRINKHAWRIRMSVRNAKQAIHNFRT